MSDDLLDNRVLMRPQIRPNADRARYAQLLILILLILDVISFFSSWMQLGLLHDLNNGVFVESSTIDSNDMREILLGYIYIAVFIVSIVTFINWFRRAYYNLGKRVKTRFTDGWASGAWFVPIISLFRPVQMMSEMWDETTTLILNKGGESKGNKVIVSVWWTIWIISNLLGNGLRRSANNATSIDDYIFSTKAEMVLSFIGVPLAIVAILVIRTYSQKEEYLAKLELNEVDYSQTVPITIDDSIL